MPKGSSTRAPFLVCNRQGKLEPISEEGSPPTAAAAEPGKRLLGFSIFSPRKNPSKPLAAKPPTPLDTRA